MAFPLYCFPLFFLHVAPDRLPIFGSGLYRKVSAGYIFYHGESKIRQISTPFPAGNSTTAGQLPVLLLRQRIEWAEVLVFVHGICLLIAQRGRAGYCPHAPCWVFLLTCCHGLLLIVDGLGLVV